MSNHSRARVVFVDSLWPGWALVAAAALTLTACGGTVLPDPAPASGPYTVGGTISGLTGAGLVLQNGSDRVTVAAGATSFTFPTAVAAAASYAVTVHSAPSGLGCSVANGTGTAQTTNITNVTVSCAVQSFSVSGTISGLSGSGLVLANGADHLAVADGATGFTLPSLVAFAASYAVTVQGSPDGSSCTVAHSTGIMGTANVNDVAVSCSARAYTLGGSISGLKGTGLVLGNGADRLAVADGATSFVFSTPVVHATSYAVTVEGSPDGLTCSVASATGSMGTANVNNVVVTCSALAFALGGTISGLNGAGLVLANGTNQVAVAEGATGFTLAAVAFGSSYAVTVATQPAGVSCAVSGGAGTMPAASVASVTVVCSDQPYTLGGTISGLSRAGLVLANAGEQLIVASGATHFTLPSPVNFASTFSVTVVSAPLGMTCTLSAGAGTMPAANVGTVTIVCADQAYPVGGSISGLNGTGLVLANGADQVTLASGASSFTLPTPVAFGSTYAVTVATQPAGVTCTVSAGAGTMAAAAVTTVVVVCADQAFTLGGTISGLTTSGLVLTDGTDWLPVAANASLFSMPTGVAYSSAYLVTVVAQPAGASCTVTGGSGVMPAANAGSVQVTCVAQFWVWQGGSHGMRASGVSGTKGTAAAGNVPGARLGAMAWQGSASQRWLFGGTGYDVNGNSDDLSDLWSYNQTTHQWTWVSGPNTSNGNGTYGTQGTAAVGNVPSSRKNSATWTDAAGNLWLLGGYHDNVGHGYLNDLWSYNTGTGLWTWVSGSSSSNGPTNDTCTNALGIYGTQGLAAAGNTPGARLGSVTWVDSAGTFWLHGGAGCDATGTLSMLNDLWSYTPALNQWTWVGGSTAAGASGVYGTQGVAAAGNLPGARQAAVSWVDSAGRFWLFGGYGVDSTGTNGNLNDLWSYDPGTNRWTWVSGANTADAIGVYGALGNTPGARNSAQAFADGKGHLLLFGGNGLDAAGDGGFLNDVWSFDTTARQWTWVSGPASIDGAGSYGTLGVGAAGNLPGARFQSVGWIDDAAHLWVFGGYGRDYTTVDYFGPLNDLFEY
jgi:N-acetylneuraminic acid mutarotase